AEQEGEAAGDGQAQAGALVLARGGAVDLPELLEDELLVFLADADAGVLDLDAAAAVAPAAGDDDVDRAPVGELGGGGHEIGDDLVNLVGVGLDDDAGGGDDVELELRLVPEQDLRLGRYLLGDVVHRHLGGVDLDLARLDLREIEDLVDEREQVARRLL